MKKPNKLLEWLKRPHGLRLIVLYAVTAMAAAGAVLFTLLPDDGSLLGIAAYVLYAVAALCLALSVYTVVRLAPAVKKTVTEGLRKHAFTGKLLEQYGFRTIVFSVLSLTVSVGYAVFNGVIALLSPSVFYGALAGYYLLLVAMRGGTLFFHRKKKRLAQSESSAFAQQKAALVNYRLCGFLLIVLPLCLSFAIAETVRSQKAFEHAGMTIYVSAVYTFYKIIMSCYNFFRARKNDDYTVQTVRNVNLADAFVSVLALQTAMFHAFSTGQNGMANALTGAAVCALTAALGIFMVVSATRKLKKAKTQIDLMQSVCNTEIPEDAVRAKEWAHGEKRENQLPAEGQEEGKNG